MIDGHWEDEPHWQDEPPAPKPAGPVIAVFILVALAIAVISAWRS